MKNLFIPILIVVGVFVVIYYNNPYLFETEDQEKIRIEREEKQCLEQFNAFEQNYIKTNLIDIASKLIELQKLRLEQAKTSHEDVPETCSKSVSAELLGVFASLSATDTSVYCEKIIINKTPTGYAHELANREMKPVILMEFMDTVPGRCFATVLNNKK